MIGILPTQMLNDALETTQARKELGIGRTLRLARGSARWGEHAVNPGLDTIRARRTLITADLPATTSYTAPHAGYIRGRAGGGGGHASARTVRRILTGGGGVQPLRRGSVKGHDNPREDEATRILCPSNLADVLYRRRFLAVKKKGTPSLVVRIQRGQPDLEHM